jgi:hypothetical protein
MLNFQFYTNFFAVLLLKEILVPLKTEKANEEAGCKIFAWDSSHSVDKKN